MRHSCPPAIARFGGVGADDPLDNAGVVTGARMTLLALAHDKIELEY
jgi:hypothetical protein